MKSLGVILFGPPGSGKGTQGRRLADRLGAAYVSTGELFRQLASEDSPRGRQVREITARGDLVPDDVTEQIVREQLEALPAERGFILDGYPRSAAQAAALERMLGERGRLGNRPAFVRLGVPRDKLLERLRRRRDVEGRSDDTDATSRHRLDVYETEAAALGDAVAGWADVVDVNGDQPVEAVTDEIERKLRAGQEGPNRHRVVVVGGGFAGIQAVAALRGAPVDVTLIDRNNYHLFQPLSYQVATGSLSPDEIAEPLRTIFRRDRHVRVVMAEVTALDLERRTVTLRPSVDSTAPQTIPFETLVVAGGSTYSYFGHDEWRSVALEVKSLSSALRVRGRILSAFEAAEADPDPEAVKRWLTFVVVGAGPTGVEMAGQIAELARHTLPGDFRAVDPRGARILIVEMADRVLPGFPPKLSARAARSLKDLGVTPLLGQTVVGIEPDAVAVSHPDGSVEDVATNTVIWAAGVTASGLARALADASESDVDRAGRVAVEPDLTLPGHPEVIAIGDMTRVRDARTGTIEVLPGLAPVAMQEGRYAGQLIRNRLAGRPTAPFRYRDKGNLATIGRARAVADLHGLHVSGFLAWALWLVVHIYYLIGFENRLVVLVRWTYSFLTRGRGARLITEPPKPPRPDAPSG